MSVPSSPKDADRDAPRKAVVFQVPCGCEVDVGTPNVAYRFCQPHAEATQHEPQPVREHVRWIWHTCADELRLVYDLQRQGAV